MSQHNLYTPSNFMHYTTGIQSIDRDHLMLFTLLRELTETHSHEIAMQVIDLFNSHALREEQHMLANEYPYLEEHKRDHERRISEFTAQLRNLSTYDVWSRFLYHIEWHDIQYSDWLKNNKK